MLKPSETLQLAQHYLASGAVETHSMPLVEALVFALKDPDMGSAPGGHYYLTAAAGNQPLLSWLLESPRSTDDQLELYSAAIDAAILAGE